MIEIEMIFSDRVTIKNIDKLPDDVQRKFINVIGVHRNPALGIKKRMGFSIYGIPQFIYSRDICRNEEGGYDGYYSRGLVYDIKDVIKEHNEIINRLGREDRIRVAKVEDRMVEVPVSWPSFKLGLEGYQQQAVTDVLISRSKYVNQGIISFPTGGGKTIAAGALLGKLGQRTLIVTHTCALVDQWIDALRNKCFGDRLHISKLGGGSDDLSGDHVVVATVQTLKKYLDSPDFQQFGCIILDECHHVAATTFIEVIGRSAAKYRYGLTASLKRKDGKHFLLHDVFGNTLVKLGYEEVENRVTLPLVTPIFYPLDLVECDGPRRHDAELAIYRQGNQAFDFAKYNKMISFDNNRNAVILELIKELLQTSNNYILVLTKLREHAQLLAASCEALAPTALLLGGGGAKEKEEQHELIAKANKGEIRIVIGTSIADEGLDIARLNKLILCVPTTWVEMLKQRIGRIIRKCEGKGTPEVFDIVDTDVSMAVGQWISRKKIYRSLDMEINEEGGEE